jgi:hypothetical protein
MSRSMFNRSAIHEECKVSPSHTGVTSETRLGASHLQTTLRQIDLEFGEHTLCFFCTLGQGNDVISEAQHVPTNWSVRTDNDLIYGPVHEEKKTNVEAKKKNADANWRRAPDPKGGAVFRPRKRTTQNGYAQCVPVLGRPLSGPENGSIFGTSFL